MWLSVWLYLVVSTLCKEELGYPGYHRHILITSIYHHVTYHIGWSKTKPYCVMRGSLSSINYIKYKPTKQLDTFI